MGSLCGIRDDVIVEEGSHGDAMFNCAGMCICPLGFLRRDTLNFPIFDEKWTAEDELLLLEGVQLLGFGNWDAIAGHVSRVNCYRTPQECEAHYLDLFVFSNTLLPAPEQYLPVTPRIPHTPAIPVGPTALTPPATSTLEALPPSRPAAAPTTTASSPLLPDTRSSTPIVEIGMYDPIPASPPIPPPATPAPAVDIPVEIATPTSEVSTPPSGSAPMDLEIIPAWASGPLTPSPVGAAKPPDDPPHPAAAPPHPDGIPDVDLPLELESPPSGSVAHPLALSTTTGTGAGATTTATTSTVRAFLAVVPAWATGSAPRSPTKPASGDSDHRLPTHPGQVHSTPDLPTSPPPGHTLSQQPPRPPPPSVPGPTRPAPSPVPTRGPSGRGSSRKPAAPQSAFQPEDVGFHPLRGDFDFEYDNDAELMVADMAIPEGDPELELKLMILEGYGRRLAERHFRKQFVSERGLLDYAAILQADGRRSAEERALLDQLRPFARFMPATEYHDLEQGLLSIKVSWGGICGACECEHALAAEIAQLQQFRRWGFRTLSEIDQHRRDTRPQHHMGPVGMPGGPHDQQQQQQQPGPTMMPAHYAYPQPPFAFATWSGAHLLYPAHGGYPGMLRAPGLYAPTRQGSPTPQYTMTMGPAPNGMTTGGKRLPGCAGKSVPAWMQARGSPVMTSPVLPMPPVPAAAPATATASAPPEDAEEHDIPLPAFVDPTPPPAFPPSPPPQSAPSPVPQPQPQLPGASGALPPVSLFGYGSSAGGCRFRRDWPPPARPWRPARCGTPSAHNF
ncbi:putative Homeodomain protein [Paratrimastix pyriformis]|uniref:Homeodomain protein n=1 Tax=Paratrimastix pyriformis TaxID=342808 RepID=A0ABQ8UYM8_9EUKA|nr:putative Homeodomain protein [Paratrimastix pyriformis]